MAESQTQKFQRRTVLIKYSLQLKYIAMVFLSVLFMSLIVGGDIYYSMARIIFLDPSLSPMVTQVNAILVVKVILYLAIMLLIALYVSHRFAGPIYRFEKSAQVVSSGDLTHRVSLRTGDELMELQEEFNGMLGSLQSMIQKDRHLAAQLAARLAAAAEKLPEENGLRKDILSIKAELEHLTKSFKV